MADPFSPSSMDHRRPPVRRRWAVVLMLVPMMLFFGYWGRLAYITAAKRQNAPAPNLAAPAAAAVDWPTLQKELAEGKTPLTQQQADLWRFLEGTPTPADRAAALRLLGEVQMDLIYSTEEGPGKQGHLVEQGQSLASIAQKYGSTVPAIVRANNLLGTNVQPGQHLVVPMLDSIELRGHLAGAQLVVYWQGRLLKSYALTAPTGPATLVGEGTIAERTVVMDGKVISFGQADYFEAVKTVKLSWGGIEIKAPAAATSPPDAAPTLLLDSKESLEEIFPLLTGSTPVIIRE